MKWLRSVFLCVAVNLLSSLYGGSPHHPFVIVSPPKCGTHLAGKAVGLIIGKEPAYYLSELGTKRQGVSTVLRETSLGHFVVAHNFSQPILRELVNRGYKIIFVVRDPRDQLISVRNWLIGGNWPWIEASKIQDRQLQLEELITGSIKGWRCFESCFLKYEALLLDFPPECIYFLRFENLVGKAGGGSNEKQLETVFEVAQFLNMSLPPTVEEAEQFAANFYGGTRTFRTGQIGNWKTHFSDRHKSLYKARYNDHLIRLGYEVDGNW